MHCYLLPGSAEEKQKKASLTEYHTMSTQKHRCCTSTRSTRTPHHTAESQLVTILSSKRSFNPTVRNRQALSRLLLSGFSSAMMTTAHTWWPPSIPHSRRKLTLTKIRLPDNSTEFAKSRTFALVETGPADELISGAFSPALRFGYY